MNHKIISIIVPIRNEEKYISQCLDSLLNQTIHLDRYEIIIVDGMSTDNTRDIVSKYMNKYSNLTLIDNPKKIAPTAMNIGIKCAKGDIIIRVDGHSYVSHDFIENNIIALEETGAKCVGGPIETIGTSTVSNAISYGMTSPFGVGNALFRYAKDPCYVDTLAFGAYRSEVFDEIGLFDEELVRNQDDELNLRLTKSGGKIYLTPKIKSFYYNRSSLKKLWRQYFQYGFWKVRVIQKHGQPASFRHLIPCVFVLSLVVPLLLSFVVPYMACLSLFSILAYVIASSFFSIKVSLSHGARYLLLMPLIYGILHFSYGFGFLSGLIKFNLYRSKLIDGT